ncbi:hypothetical protein HDA40_001885 [Hamadaea flava]|uniref:Uncharacterized protein n=1 Tax=Hamadaea flava TaxID=1742688 RepID=A0ABV8LEU9_9ACTN|nr:hypothetical protein [Hamadaea flava]MCP2323378.1 hypothetical protein [Hamadaea flava]
MADNTPDPGAIAHEPDPDRQLQRKLLEGALKRLAAGAGGPTLREMANDILAGRADLREAVGHGFYTSELAARATAFQQWLADMSDGDRAELERRTTELMGHLRTNYREQG